MKTTTLLTILNILTIITIFTTTSCSKKSPAPVTKTTITFGHIRGTGPLSTDGGIMVWGESTGEGDSFGIGVPVGNTTSITVAKGTWSFYAISWCGGTGGLPMEGDVSCAKQVNVTLSEDTQTVSLALNPTKCNDADFAALEFRDGNQFKPIKLVSCSDLHGITPTDETSCNYPLTKIGAGLSFTLAGRSYHLTNPTFGYTSDLTSNCVNYTTDPGAKNNSIYPTGIRFPIGGNKSHLFAMGINSFDDSSCSRSKFKLNYPGVPTDTQRTTDAIKYSSTGYTTLFFADNEFASGYTPFFEQIPWIDCSSTPSPPVKKERSSSHCMYNLTGRKACETAIDTFDYSISEGSCSSPNTWKEGYWCRVNCSDFYYEESHDNKNSCESSGGIWTIRPVKDQDACLISGNFDYAPQDKTTCEDTPYSGTWTTGYWCRIGCTKNETHTNQTDCENNDGNNDGVWKTQPDWGPRDNLRDRIRQIMGTANGSDIWYGGTDDEYDYRETGEIGEIAMLLGGDGIGGILYKHGISSCETVSALNTTLSQAVSEHGGSPAIYYLKIGDAEKTIPSGYGEVMEGKESKSRRLFEKRITVYREGQQSNPTFAFEFNCSDGYKKVGWFAYNYNPLNEDFSSTYREYGKGEVYYDATDTSSAKVELQQYEVNVPTIENQDRVYKTIMRFEKQGTDKFNLWATAVHCHYNTYPSPGYHWNASRIGAFGNTTDAYIFDTHYNQATITFPTTDCGSVPAITDPGIPDYTSGVTCINYQNSTVDCGSVPSPSNTSPVAPLFENTVNSFGMQAVGELDENNFTDISLP